MNDRLMPDMIPDWGCNQGVIDAVAAIGAECFGDDVIHILWGHSWCNYMKRLESVAEITVDARGRSVQQLWDDGYGRLPEVIASRLGGGIATCVHISVDIIDSIENRTALIGEDQ